MWLAAGVKSLPPMRRGECDPGDSCERGTANARVKPLRAKSRFREGISKPRVSGRCCLGCGRSPLSAVPPSCVAAGREGSPAQEPRPPNAGRSPLTSVDSRRSDLRLLSIGRLSPRMTLANFPGEAQDPRYCLDNAGRCSISELRQAGSAGRQRVRSARFDPRRRKHFARARHTPVSAATPAGRAGMPAQPSWADDVASPGRYSYEYRTGGSAGRARRGHQGVTTANRGSPGWLGLAPAEVRTVPYRI